MAKKLRSLGHLTCCLLFLVAPEARASKPASSNVANLCDRAAISAARVTGVPLNVLRAITLTETGRKADGKMRPWPWTVNMEGAGRWFEGRASAEAYAKTNFARGARSFDVGCFQINYRWHGKAFPSIEAMFDPEANALYAARFLQSLHEEFGDWVKAAGAYHSRTPKFARRYEARFERFLAGLEPVDIVQPARVESAPAAPKPNRFPLIQRTPRRGSLASLVPLGGAATDRLIDISGQ
ncbi:MAG: transglycosylase SLT domain-containing protein [Pseudomonadota bacterium]